MHPVIYDVAVSVDGVIAGPGQDISKFAHDGAVVDDYRDRLAGYACAIMGRHTYEFGYRFGMAPGDNPYPHMETYVFSRTLALPEDADVTCIAEAPEDIVRGLKSTSSGPIYLCGGGQFAAALLRHRLIDRLRLKRAPIVLGGGTPLFDPGPGDTSLRLTTETSYGDGYLFQEFHFI